MSRTLSSDMLQEMQAQQTGEAFLILLDLEHNTLDDPIRITSDGVNTYQTIRQQEDLSGNGNDIVLVNGPTWTRTSAPNSNLEGAIRFDGVNDYIQINKLFYSSAINTLTVEVWIKALSSGTIISFDEDHYWALEVMSTGKVRAVFTTNLGKITDFTSEVSVLDGEWHHVAFSLNSSGVTNLIVDTVTENSGGFGSSIGTGQTRYGFIGIGSAASKQGGLTKGTHFKGDMTEVRIWTTYRSVSTISAFKDVRLLGSESALEAYWSLDVGRYTYLPFPFRFEAPSDTENGDTRATIEIDNIDRSIVEVVRTIQSPPKITVQVVRGSNPDETEVEWPDFDLVEVEYDAFVVSGTIGQESFVLEPFPKDTFNHGTFPAVF